MSGIKRYDVEPLNPVGQSVDESVDGRWVYFDDHAAEIARLRAEADQNRLDAERWRHARQQNGVTVSIEESDDEGDKQFVSGHSPEELDEAIDAALSGQE